jgi:hypothetical protein
MGEIAERKGRAEAGGKHKDKFGIVHGCAPAKRAELPLTVPEGGGEGNFSAAGGSKLTIVEGVTHTCR